MHAKEAIVDAIFHNLAAYVERIANGKALPIFAIRFQKLLSKCLNQESNTKVWTPGLTPYLMLFKLNAQECCLLLLNAIALRCHA